MAPHVLACSLCYPGPNLGARLLFYSTLLMLSPRPFPQQAILHDLRNMFQMSEADCQQVYLSVVKPLLTKRLTAMMEHGDLAAEVKT